MIVTDERGLGAKYTQNDCDECQSHFGQIPSSGSGTSANVAVPDPATLMMLILAAAGWYLRQGQAAKKALTTHQRVKRFNNPPYFETTPTAWKSKPLDCRHSSPKFLAKVK